MTALRFKFEIGGETLHGLAFGSEAELDAFLACRDHVELSSHARAQISPPDDPEPRPPGRPSFDDVLSEAVKLLGDALDPRTSLSARARRLLRHLAETHTAEEIPSMSKARAFLAERPVARNSASKSARKPKRARIARTEGV